MVAKNLKASNMNRMPRPKGRVVLEAHSCQTHYIEGTLTQLKKNSNLGSRACTLFSLKSIFAAV
jgi:hypothetical protein